jgi:hypothetical protein
MSVACGAEVCGRFLWGSDTSNKPFEWTGRHHLSAEHPKILACHSRAALAGPSEGGFAGQIGAIV